MRARREKGLCYNCDELFTPSHKCKQSHMFFLMTAEEAAYESQNSTVIEEVIQQDTYVDISFNTMVGSSCVNAIKVHGTKGKHKLTQNGNSNKG